MQTQSLENLDVEKLLEDALDMLEGDVTITAFVVWNRNSVVISSPMHTSLTHLGWAFSNEMKCWVLNNTIYLVSKHQTCLKSRAPGLWCDACNNRRAWRSKCQTPNDLYFLLPSNTTRVCNSILRPIVQETTELSAELLKGYLKKLPRIRKAKK